LSAVGGGHGGARLNGMRAEGWVYRLMVALSGLTLALVVAYLVLAQENRTVQAEVNRRQQFINQSVELARINDALIRALATAAVKKKDDKLRDLLTRNGITINPSGNPQAGPSPATSPAPIPAGAGKTP
jgi:hypothetical protein